MFHILYSLHANVVGYLLGPQTLLSTVLEWHQLVIFLQSESCSFVSIRDNI